MPRSLRKWITLANMSPLTGTYCSQLSKDLEIFSTRESITYTRSLSFSGKIIMHPEHKACINLWYPRLLVAVQILRIE
jgi:hypothetical protein